MAQGLGHVAQHGASARVHLLMQQAKVAGGGRKQRVHLLHRRAVLAEQGERLHQPERAGEEGALLGLHARIPEHQRAAAQLAPDRVAGERQPVAALEAETGREQERGVQPVRPGMHDVALLLVRPAMRVDPVADAVTLAPPAVGMAGVKLARRGEPGRAVERRPATELRHGVVLGLLQLPDAGVAAAPQVGAAVGKLREQAPGREVEDVAALDEQRRGLHQIAEHAELELPPRPVALAHRPAVPVTRQVQHPLLRREVAVEAIHHAQLPAVAEDGGDQPGERGLGLLDRADPQERLDGVGDVARPGEAVVVVLPRPDPLRQRGGRRRRRGARGREQQQLEGERAAPHRLPVAALIGQVRRPLAPGLVRPVDPSVDGGERRQDQRLVGGSQQRQHRA